MYQSVGEVMMGIWSIKEMRDPWDSQRNEKNVISTSIAFCLDFLIRNENITSEEGKTKKPFEIILHVGRVINRTFVYKGLTVT